MLLLFPTQFTLLFCPLTFHLQVCFQVSYIVFMINHIPIPLISLCTTIPANIHFSSDCQAYVYDLSSFADPSFLCQTTLTSNAHHILTQNVCSILCCNFPACTPFQERQKKVNQSVTRGFLAWSPYPIHVILDLDTTFASRGGRCMCASRGISCNLPFTTSALFRTQLRHKT